MSCLAFLQFEILIERAKLNCKSQIIIIKRRIIKTNKCTFIYQATWIESHITAFLQSRCEKAEQRKNETKFMIVIIEKDCLRLYWCMVFFSLSHLPFVNSYPFFSVARLNGLNESQPCQCVRAPLGSSHIDVCVNLSFIHVITFVCSTISTYSRITTTQ